MSHRRRRVNPFRVVILSALVLGAVYVNQVVVPTTPPLFMPTLTPTRAPEAFIADAETLEREGKYTQAISAYEDAIQVAPRNAGNFIALARLQMYSGLYQEALTSAENALLINPNNATAHALRGWAMTFLGDYLEAEASLDTAIELEPNNPIPYAYHAELILKKIDAGQEDTAAAEEASDLSKKAADLGNNTMEAHRARALVLEWFGTSDNLEVAIQEYEAAIRLNPNVADLHVGLGRVYRAFAIYSGASDMYVKSLDEFKRAITLNPTDPWAYSYASRTYAQQGEFVRAIDYALLALERDPANPYWHGNLGQLYYKQFQYTDALAHLRLAVRGGEYVPEEGEPVTVEGLTVTDEPQLGYYSNYGLTLAYLGQCGEALEISQFLTQSFPQDEFIPFNAQEMVNICQNLLETGSTTPTETPTAEDSGG